MANKRNPIQDNSGEGFVLVVLKRRRKGIGDIFSLALRVRSSVPLKLEDTVPLRLFFFLLRN